MRRREYFRISAYRRRYDRSSGKFIIDISYKTAVPKPTNRVVSVAESFGLGLDQWEKFVVYDNAEFKIGPKDIVYITGDSGSGKSVLLKALEKDIKKDMGLSCINIADIRPELGKPLIETVGETLEEGLELLSKVGLNDAFLFLRTYEQLSDGQKYRYKIAKMMESKAQFWIMDEFCLKRGTSILSERALMPIEQIRVHDRVLTHEALQSLGYYPIKTADRTSEWRRSNYHPYTYPFGKRRIKLSLHRQSSHIKQQTKEET